MIATNLPKLSLLLRLSLLVCVVGCSEGSASSAGGGGSSGSSTINDVGAAAMAGAGGAGSAEGAAGTAAMGGAGGTEVTSGGAAGNAGAAGAGIVADGNAAIVAATPGLIAFWDFDRTEDELWTSYSDPAVTTTSFPIFIRRIGDPLAYQPDQWPYTDPASELVVDEQGPFERSVRFNRGYVFGEVPRALLDGTPLDINGRAPFTLVAWTKFTGQRHMVAGIWDEGGWDPYGGQRQFALFGGLFGSAGIIAHVSATGAASYPQSKVAGAQYARLKAMDGQAFENGRWVSMAMAYDPAAREVSAYLDGKLTPRTYGDPVIQDVFGHKLAEPVNPAAFDWPIFSARAFILKFNGYALASSGVAEHWLHIEADQHRATYDRFAPAAGAVKQVFRVRLDLVRAEQSLLTSPLEWDATEGASVSWPDGIALQDGDEVVTSLLSLTGGVFTRVGTELRHTVRLGAPLTFGRAMGLGSEELTHGSELRLGGVAVFNRVLSEGELKAISFPVVE